VANYGGLLVKAVQRLRLPEVGGTAERILDAALHQFELIGIDRTTVDDISRRARLARVTLYRHFPGKDDIIEAVLLRELGNFLIDLESAARRHEAIDDRLVEGFVFTLNAARSHRLLGRLLATEPESILPFLTTEGDSFLRAASEFLAAQLALVLPGDARTHEELLEVAEVTTRIILSMVLTPPQFIALDDDSAARGFARRYLVPPLLGYTAAP